MIHLFSKTYLDLDSFIITDLDRIVISETNGYPMVQLLDDLSDGTLVTFGPTIEEVVGPEKRFSSMAEMLEFCYDHNESTDRKIIFNCDKVAFVKIAAYLFKLIFANIDADSAYRIIDAAFSRHILLGGRDILYAESKWLDSKPTKAEFVAAFNSTTVDVAAASLLTKIKTKASVEYLLASYFYNGSYKDNLKPIVRLMMTRNAEEELKETWRSLQTNILRPSVQQAIGTQSYTIDNVTDMVNDPALAALKKTNAWRAANGVASPREPLDLTTFTDAEITKLKEQVVWLRYFVFGFDDSSPMHQRIRLYIDLLKKPQLTDADLDAVLNFEHVSQDDDRFWSLKDRDHINIFLIEHILEAKKSNNLSVLQPYLLK